MLNEAILIITEGLEHNPDASELYYRIVAYLIAIGKYNEALGFLEKGLMLNPGKYPILFEYLPQLQGNKVILDIINRYRKGS